MYRKGGYIVARVFGFFIVALMATLVAVQTPYVQTRLTKRIIDDITDKLDAKISYSKIKVMSSGVLLIKDLAVLDCAPYSADEFNRGWEVVDTIFSAKTIAATFSIKSLIYKEGLHLGRVIVENGSLHLTTEPGLYVSNINRVFKFISKDKIPEPGGDLFDINRVRVRDFRFRLNSFIKARSEYSGYGLNYDDLDVLVNARGHSLRFSGGKLSAVLDRSSIIEKSGYTITSCRAKCMVGQGKTIVENIHFTDQWSDIRADYFTQTFTHPRAFARYIEEILMEGSLERSTLSANTIMTFSGQPADNPAVLEIRSGKMKGYVNDFSVENFVFKETLSNSSGTLNGTVIGLPDIKSMILNVKLNKFNFTTAGLSRLWSGINGGKRNTIAQYARGKRLTLNATAKGVLDKIRLRGRLSLNSGTIDLDADLRNLINQSRAIEIKADVNAKDLDVDVLTGIGDIGKCTMLASGSVILHEDMPEINLDTLSVGSLTLRGHTFRNISANGSLIDKTASGMIKCDDPNLNFNIAALADLEPIGGTTRYKVMGKVINADLRAIQPDSREVATVSMDIYANLADNSFLHGDAYINGLVYTNADGVHDLGDLVFRAFPSSGKQGYRFVSDFFEASMTGSGSFFDFIDDIQDVTTRKSLPAIYPQAVSVSDAGEYDLDILFHDTRGILSLFSPGLYIADSTRAELSVSRLGNLEGKLVSSRLASGTDYLKNINLSFDNRNSSLNVSLSGDELRSGALTLLSPSLKAFAQDNSIALSALFDNDSNSGGNGELFVNGQIYRDSTNLMVVKAHPLDSYIRAGDETWSIDESDIIIHGSDIYIDKFKIANGVQSILADGGISKNRKDTLFVDISNIDLSIVDNFLPHKYDIKGRLGGRSFLTSEEGKALGLLMNIKLDSLQIAGVDAGNIRLSSMLDDEGDKLDIFLRNYNQGRDALYARGSYGLTDRRLNLNTTLDKLPLALAKPFLSTLFSDIDGSLSGEISLAGPLDELASSSKDLFVNDAKLRLLFTGAPYTISGPLRLDNAGLFFDSLQISDGAGGTGSIVGALNHKYLRDLTLDSRINFSNLGFVNAAEQDDSNIYGLLKASGNAIVTGPLSSLNVEANINTSGEGNIHIPVSGSLVGNTGDLLTFTEPVKKYDAYEQMLANYQAQEAKKSNVKILATVTASPEVKSYIEIDKANGNVISFSGNGTVRVAMNPADDLMNLNGDYIINEGQYQFVLPGVLSKLFEIQNGSSIKFGGNLMDTQLDINAMHEVRTSLSSLIADSTSVSTRRLVECGIAITDRLKNPQMDFSVNVPDLDPTTKSQVESALNTADKVQKQFISLLLMGSFIPGEFSGVFDGNSILLSNISNLMSGQINSIMQRLEIPLDVHLDYQGVSGGTNIFDLAVSTQLLNNRIIVGGSVGNRKYKTTSNANGEMVGDLDIQVKLDNQGKFRLNLFSHSADEYTSFLDFSQRNGIGISYQKEFNSVGAFFNNLFISKERREKEAVEKLDEQVTISISNEE